VSSATSEKVNYRIDDPREPLQLQRSNLRCHQVAIGSEEFPRSGVAGDTNVMALSRARFWRRSRSPG
jgi:hypothetical protein